MYTINQTFNSDQQAPVAPANFVLLLISLMLLFLVFPCLAMGNHTKRHLLFNGLLFTTQLSAVHSVSRNHRFFPLAVILAISAMGLHWLAIVTHIQVAAISSLILDLFLFGLTTLAILSHVMRSTQVNSRKIMGAICAYLMIGLIWALASSFLYAVDPTSFRIVDSLVVGNTTPLNAVAGLPEFIYFSFSTLTTLGYGDMIPVSPAARAMASLEAITGQLYLTILVARLVGLHIIQSQTHSANIDHIASNKWPMTKS